MNTEPQSTKASLYKKASEPVMRRALLIEMSVGCPDSSLRSKLDAQDVVLVGEFNHVDGLFEQIKECEPEVLIVSVDFLDAKTLERLLQVNKKCPLPIVVFAKQHAPKLGITVVDAGISSYVVDDVQAHRIPVIVELAVARFLKMQTLSIELEQTKNQLSERKLIEKAKGLIMQQNNLSEDEAYSQMRKSAMDQGRSMAELSKRIIEVFDIFG